MKAFEGAKYSQNPKQGRINSHSRARYFPSRFPQSTWVAQTALSWIPKCGEIIETSAQLDLLEEIWDGRQKHILEDSESTDNAYLIDFENRLMEVEG